MNLQNWPISYDHSGKFGARIACAQAFCSSFKNLNFEAWSKYVSNFNIFIMNCICFYLGCSTTVFRLLFISVIVFECNKAASPTILYPSLTHFGRKSHNHGNFGKLPILLKASCYKCPICWQNDILNSTVFSWSLG